VCLARVRTHLTIDRLRKDNERLVRVEAALAEVTAELRELRRSGRDGSR
jgi:hypothetical protein